MPRLHPRLAVSLLLVLPLLSTRAATKSDLERIKPVAADQVIPLSDYFRPALMQTPAINLAGTHIAAPIAVGQDQYSLMVYDLGTKKVEIAAVPPDRDVRTFWWAGDDHLLYVLTARKLGDVGIAATTVGKLDRSYAVIQSAGAMLVRVPEATPLQPLVWMAGGNETGHDEGVSVANAAMNSGPLLDLLSVNTSGSAFSDVKDNNIRHTIQTYPVPAGGITTRYLCDKDDALAFAITSKAGVDTLHRLVGRVWEKCPVDLDEIEVVDTGNQPGELVVLGPRQPDKARALQFLDAATGKLGDVLLEDPEYDFNGTLQRDRVTHKIIGARYQRNGPRTVWFDENARAIQMAVDGLFKGQVVNILDWNRAMTRFVIAHYTDRQPVAYDWVDLEKKSAGPINSSRPWLDAARMQPMQMFKFKTKDGRRLDAYLTLPAGATAEHPVPLVVLVHGGSRGPATRDQWGFNPEAQFYAARGYAVLQPNYRGSPGYNWAFPHEDEWDYLKMHEDVTAATNAVLRTKLIDRARIAIVGSAFGGYLATCGVTNEPGLYRCAVTINGIYDWAAMVRETKYSANTDAYHDWLLRRLGDPDRNQARYDAISPLTRAEQIKAAVFVVYGKGSSPVEIGQPRALLSALDRAHAPHEELVIADDVHGLGYLDRQLEMRERIEAFLAKHLGAATK